MTTYELFRYVFLGSAVACGICVVMAAVLFFTLKIPKVVSDLTGRTARKAIENIRLQNEQSGDKSYQSSAVNRERGKLTDKISRSGRLVPNDSTVFGIGRITEKISTQQLDSIEPGGETTLLIQENETSVLADGYGETSVLAPEPIHTQPAQQLSQVFVIEHEITFVHTDEVIV